MISRWMTAVAAVALVLASLPATAAEIFPFTKKGKSGYKEKGGKVVIEPQYEYASEFSEGLAAVGQGEYPNTKWGYIDATGKLVIPLQFAAAHNFSEGRAAVSIDGKLGYIDKTGKVVIKAQFDEAQKFQDGKARVRIVKEGYGYVDKDGKFVEPLKL